MLVKVKEGYHMVTLWRLGALTTCGRDAQLSMGLA
jgi:hypothetical protein